LRWSEGGVDAVQSGQLTFLIGDKPEDEDSARYVTREGFGFTGTVWESSVERLIAETLEDLAGS